MTEIEKEDYKKMLHIETRSNPSFLYDNKQQTPIDVYNKYENNYELWVKLNELDPFIKRCLHLKYSYNFEQIRTNKQVAEMMCCSSETIRKTYNNSNIFSLISL
jgi:DNA-directed RNA polymerase sigma subunit (sigma70/sigma32)